MKYLSMLKKFLKNISQEDWFIFMQLVFSVIIVVMILLGIVNFLLNN